MQRFSPGRAWASPVLYKNRPELETSIGSLDTFRQILENSDTSGFRYEKYRTEYAEDGHGGTIMVDETPIGDFMEIEGAGDWIDATANRLGFTRRDYVLESYGRLYLDHCRKHGLEPDNMVFASQSAEAGRAESSQFPLMKFDGLFKIVHRWQKS